MRMLYTRSCLWCVLFLMFIGSVLPGVNKEKNLRASNEVIGLLAGVKDNGIDRRVWPKMCYFNTAAAAGAWVSDTKRQIQVEVTFPVITTSIPTKELEISIPEYHMSVSTTKCSSLKPHLNNSDYASVVERFLTESIRARCLRLSPLSYDGKRTSLHFEQRGRPEEIVIQDHLFRLVCSERRCRFTDRRPAYRNITAFDSAPAFESFPTEPLKKVVKIPADSRSSVSRRITRYVHLDWVTSYTLAFSKPDCDSDSFTYFSVTKLFSGNGDNHTVVENGLKTPVVARCIRLHPKSYHRHPCMRFDIEGCPANSDGGRQTIPFKNFSSTFVDSHDHPSLPNGTTSDTHCTKGSPLLAEAQVSVHFANGSYRHLNTSKIHLNSSGGSWPCSESVWIEVKFINSTAITKVLTQGDSDHWVKTYELSYSTDCTSYTSYEEPMVFRSDLHQGTMGSSDLKETLDLYHRLNQHKTKCVRIYPRTCQGNICLEFHMNKKLANKRTPERAHEDHWMQVKYFWPISITEMSLERDDVTYSSAWLRHLFTVECYAPFF